MLFRRYRDDRAVPGGGSSGATPSFSPNERPRPPSAERRFGKHQSLRLPFWIFVVFLLLTRRRETRSKSAFIYRSSRARLHSALAIVLPSCWIKDCSGGPSREKINKNGAISFEPIPQIPANACQESKLSRLNVSIDA